MRRRRALRAAVLFLLCTGLLAAFWYGTRAHVVTIATIEVSGGKTIDASGIQKEAESILNGSYLFLIPKRFSYTYPHDALVDAIKRESRVADVSITRTSPTALSVALVEYIPYALWCGYQDATQDVSAGCLYLSEDGLAFANAPSLKGAVFLRYMTEGRSPEVGTTIASAEYVAATKAFAERLLEKHGMRVYAIIETPEGDVRYRVRGGGELFVSKNADIQDVFENLDAILASNEFKHIASGNFVYIDLRFGSKVFVKEFPDTPKTETGRNP